MSCTRCATGAAILAMLSLSSSVDAGGIIGPEQRLSPKEYWEQNSPAVATEGSNVVVAWYRRIHRSYVNYAYSADRGATWVEGAGLPMDPSTDHVDLMPPAICAGTGGVFYLAVRYFLYRSFSQYGVWVYRATTSGGVLSWMDPVLALPLVAYTAPYELPYEEVSIACDASGERVYLACTRVDEGVPAISTTVIFTHSTDAGLTWAPAETLSSNKSRGPSVVLHPDESMVTVSWQDFDTGNMLSRTSLACLATECCTPGPAVGGSERAAAPVQLGPCPLLFGPPVVIGAAHDNRTRPPGIYFNNHYNPAALPGLNALVPNYSKLAVDKTQGANRGSLYAVWAAGAYGTALPGTGRTVTAVEPNDYWGGATPIEIGDDVIGDAVSPDVGEDVAEIFSFHGEQGTTLALQAMATSGPGYGFGLHCGSDTTQLYRIGSTGGLGSFGPMYLVTLPVTGTYYLEGPNSASIYTIGYRGRVRRLEVDPASAARDQRDIVLSASRDGGQTWSEPVRVNDDPPWWDNSLGSVAVDGNGTVHVVWYGRTDDGECGKLVDVYWASSTDGGRTFEPSRRVSRNSSRWLAVSNGPGDVGDHLGLAATGSDVHVAWTQEGLPDLDIYHARITDVVTSTLLRRLEAVREDGCVVVRWEFTASAGVEEVCVHRSAAQAEETRVACAAEGPAVGQVCDAGAPSSSASYRLWARFADGRTEWFGPVTVETAGTSAGARFQVQPNPFTKSIRLHYEPATFGSRVQVRVLDLAGRRVATLFEGPVVPGRQELFWDGTQSGREAPPGIYYVEVRGALRTGRVRVAKLN